MMNYHPATEAIFNDLKAAMDEREARSILRILIEDLRLHNLQKNGNGGEVTAELTQLRQAVERVLSGEPVQYVTSRAHFYGYEFEVSPSVLIPRPETEELVYELLKVIPKIDRPRILDVGTGSGCIAVVLAMKRPNAHVLAVDVSEEALKVAQKNSEKYAAGVSFSCLDILESNPFRTEIPALDILVSNPPYIKKNEVKWMSPATLNHEPKMALFPGGDDPLVFYKRIRELLPEILVVGGHVFLELNEFNAGEVRDLYVGHFEDVEILIDMQGKKRVLKAVGYRAV